MLLNVMSDEKILLTPYGELRPPLGKHRLKVSLSLVCYLVRSIFHFLIAKCISDVAPIAS